MKQRKVLFVCTGNLCRSPMAEVIFRKMADGDSKLGDMGVDTRSAGTLNLDGHRPLGEAVTVIKERGLDISGHRAKTITQEMVDWADIIVVMEARHIEYIGNCFPLRA